MPPVAAYGDDSNEGIAARLEGLRLSFRDPAGALRFPTKNSFADFLDFAPSQYGNYVQARNRISLDEAIVVARKTQATLDWIYLGNPAGLPWDVSTSLFGETGLPQPQVTAPRASRRRGSAP